MFDKNVFIVANSAFTVFNFRKELLELLADEGANIFVVIPQLDHLPDCDMEYICNNLDIRVCFLNLQRNGLNPISDITYMIKLYLLFKRYKPDCVLNYTIKPTIFSSLAARIYGVRSVFSNITGIGYLLSGSGLKANLLSFLVYPLYKIALSMNEKIFFQNPDDANLFLTKKLICKNRIVYLNGSGINIERFTRKEKLPTSTSFIFVGRLLKDKGIYEFIKASQMIRQSDSMLDIDFSIAGQVDDNPESISLEELRELSEEDGINYLGAISDIRSCLEKYQVLVLPSYREGTPRVCLEAMSMEMPIITTDAPGCKEVIVDQFNGFCVPVKDAKALASAMMKFINNECDPIIMGLNGRRLAISKYSVHEVNKLILNTIKSSSL